MNNGNTNCPTGRASFEYLPALDGFRAISIAFVVIGHAKMGLDKIFPGGLGVLVFFVISGFLLTRQMIVEIEYSGRLDLRAFYLRRVFRLAPALLVYLVLFTTILKSIGATIPITQILSGVFYFSNYYNIFIGYTEHNPVPITWSLSVEEHYYILFPIILTAFRRHLPSIIPWLGAAMLFSLVWRLILFNLCQSEPIQDICGLPDKIRMDATDTIFDCILYGSTIAILLHYYNAKVRLWLINTPSFIFAFFLLLATLFYRDPMFRDTLRFSLQSIAVAVLIINVLFGTGISAAFRSLLSTKPFIMVGRVSYSLYLFHFGVLNILYIVDGTRNNLTGISDLFFYITLTILLSALSYKLVEQPAIKLRKRFGSHIDNL